MKSEESEKYPNTTTRGSAESLPHAERFTELVVYAKSRELARDVFKLSKGFPREETYSLTDQVRRSSRSIGAQIAEAWAKRKYEKHFLSKLSDADGEQLETEHWVRTAGDCGYLTEAQQKELIGLCMEIGRMLYSMSEKSASFCGDQNHRVRETHPEYFCRGGEGGSEQ